MSGSKYEQLIHNGGSDSRDYGSTEEAVIPMVGNDASTTYSKEFKVIGKSSIPMIITFFLQYSLTVVSIFSVGHIGKTELAAVSLSTMTFNITVSIFNGMSTCLDTFCSQAYGAGKLEMVGLHFQRCTLMIFVAAIPVNLIWWFSGSILNCFVPNKELTDLAQLYLRIISFGSPGYILFETGKRFLQAQGIFQAAQYVLFICTPLNALLNYLLVWHPKFGIGFAGAPLATAFNYCLMAALLLCYVVFIDGRKCWNGLKLKESFQNWGPMFSLALPGVIMVEAEFLAFEILTISASRFGTETLAAQSIASTMATLTFQIPFGVSIAGSTRIATFVGSQSARDAEIAIRVSLLLSVVLGTIICTSIVLAKYQIVSLFTNDLSVIHLAVSVIKILGINQLYDSINVIAAGCLRGQGRQKIGSNLNIACYYMIAVPLALYLAFVKDLKLVGLWIGLGTGIFTLAISETYFVLKSNWQEILSESMKRNIE